MRLMKLAVLPAILLLAGCNTIRKGGGNSDSSNVHSGVVHQTYPNVDGDPAPECIPFQAPHDYEGVTPAQADPYDAYFYVSHKEANQHHLAINYGTAIADKGTFRYTQRMAGMTMNDETTYFNMFVTTGEISLGSLTGFQPIAKATRGFEDVTKGIYMGQETAQGADVSIDENPVEGIYSGHASAWGSPQTASNRQGFFDRFGHDLFALNSYYVPDSSAIASAEMAPNEEDGTYTFTYTLNLDSKNGHTDAATWYRDTLNDGVASGIVDFDIQSLTWQITVDTEWNLLRVHSVERYTVTALGGAISVEVVNATDTKIVHYDDIQDIVGTSKDGATEEGVKSAVAMWNSAVSGLDAQGVIDIID